VVAVLGLVGALAGCDVVFRLDHAEPDASHPPPDAFVFPRCEGVALDQPGTTIADLIGQATDDPTLRQDRLEIFYDKYEAGTVSRQIFHATRARIDAPFEIDFSAVAHDVVAAFDNQPAITLDGSMLVFERSLDGGATFYLYFTTRRSDGTWQIPQLLPGLEQTVVDWLDLAYDGLTVYFADAAGRLMQAQRSDLGLPFGTPTPIGDGVGKFTISSDKLEMFCQRTDPSCPGNAIFYTTRSSSSEMFGVGTQVLCNATAHDPDLTPDGRVLVLDGPLNGPIVYNRSCP
jgi:hypothetical protein